MKAIMKLVVLCVLALPILIGCSTQSDGDADELDKIFATLVPVTDMNQSLQIVVYGNESAWHLGSDIPLIVSNKSTHHVYFDANSHIRLLISSGGQWEDIQNAFTYSGTMLLSPQGTPLLDLQYTDVRPTLNESSLNTGNSDVLLRVVIIGEIMEDDTRTGQKVGAFVDVVLEP